ncbi:MAG: cation transporter [SAR324 cluster bacterium]|nr:cation transporter [SAR324 cluster bacterium]
MNQKETLYDVSQIRKVTWGGLAVNISLTGVKFLVGILGKSQAVVADAIHSLSDMATDVAVLLGVRFWTAPPDKDHPYGHKRIEALVTIAIGLALTSVAVGLCYNALSTLRDDHIQKVGWIAIIGPIMSILLKEVLFQWTIRVGKQVKSTAVIANAWHHRSDALSSIPALIAVGISVTFPDWEFVDQVGAVIIAIFIFKVAWDIAYPSLQELSDSGASQNKQNQIKRLAMTVQGVESVHAIRTRKFGSSLHVDLHVLVAPDLSVLAGHTISENVKKELIGNGPDVLDVVVHLEPFDHKNRNSI